MTRSGRLFMALALSAGIAGTACTVRGSGYVGASTTPVVYQEPPQDQVETVNERPGHVWIRGRWDWQNNQWAWVGGHWEAERAGFAWQAGRWERRGNQWHWVEGRWAGGGSVTVTTTHDHHDGGGVVVRDHRDGGGATVTVDAGIYPSAAPPAVRVENYGAPRNGFLWISGRWDWRGGQWAWVDGHWERERANQRWNPGRWELQNGRWTWNEGSWGNR